MLHDVCVAGACVRSYGVCGSVLLRARTCNVAYEKEVCACNGWCVYFPSCMCSARAYMRVRCVCVMKRALKYRNNPNHQDL